MNTASKTKTIAQAAEQIGLHLCHYSNGNPIDPARLTQEAEEEISRCEALPAQNGDWIVYWLSDDWDGAGEIEMGCGATPDEATADAEKEIAVLGLVGGSLEQPLASDSLMARIAAAADSDSDIAFN